MKISNFNFHDEMPNNQSYFKFHWSILMTVALRHIYQIIFTVSMSWIWFYFLLMGSLVLNLLHISFWWYTFGVARMHWFVKYFDRPNSSQQRIIIMCAIAEITSSGNGSIYVCRIRATAVYHVNVCNAFDGWDGDWRHSIIIMMHSFETMNIF